MPTSAPTRPAATTFLARGDSVESTADASTTAPRRATGYNGTPLSVSGDQIADEREAKSGDSEGEGAGANFARAADDLHIERAVCSKSPGSQVGGQLIAKLETRTISGKYA